MVEQGLRVLERVAAIEGFTARPTHYPFGAEHYLKTQEVLPDSAFEEIRGHSAILLGAIGHPGVKPGILEKGIPVKVELNVEAKFYDETTPNGFNTIAEIPGSDPVLKDEVVMLGGHFDSWHAATGTTDNATGSAVMMEAARILKAIGVKPRRTIRIGLWSGEEQGLLGSRAYVEANKDKPWFVYHATNAPRKRIGAATCAL